MCSSVCSLLLLSSVIIQRNISSEVCDVWNVNGMTAQTLDHAWHIISHGMFLRNDHLALALLRRRQTPQCLIWLKMILFELKFGYSEKATKYEKNLPLKIWRYWVASNFKWKIFFKFCGLLRISKLDSVSTYTYIDWNCRKCIIVQSNNEQLMRRNKKIFHLKFDATQ